MIPVKLELHNFLAYRSPEALDFTGLHLACLAGANGAGKSSLLDAITWSLWGKARAQRDDELIHGDEMEMNVRLEFSLDGNLYRATRHRSRKKRESLLFLEIKDGEDWRSLTENTIRATQEKITRLLRLDYTTFINSAFLVQGRADEFTTKTPGERKAILGEILGLDAWVDYEERAKNRLREIDEQCTQIEGSLRSIEDELACEADYQRDLIKAQQDLDALTQQVREAEAQFRELEKARHDREAHLRSHDEAQHYIKDAEEQLNRIVRDRQQQMERLARYEAILARAEEIETGYAALKQAREVDQDQSDRLLSQRDLSEQRSQLQQVIHAARTGFEAERANLHRERLDLEKSIHEADASEVLREKEIQIAELEQREIDREEWRTQLSTLREERAGLEAENRSLRAEMDRLVKQREQIQATTEPICPLCGQDLSDTHRMELLEKLGQEGKVHGDQYRANQRLLKEMDAEEAGLKEQIQAADQALRGMDALREYITRQSERTRQASEALSKLVSVEERLRIVEAQLDSAEYTIEEQEALVEIEAQLAELGYDERAHQESRATLKRCEVYEGQKAELDRAQDSGPEIEAGMAGLDSQARYWDEAYSQQTAKRDMLAAEIEALNQQLADLGRWEHDLGRLREKEGQARVRVGAADQKLNALEQQRIRRTKLLEDQERLSAERSIYEELRLAFSKDGVPAMIIEAAIPEIEQEANQILARMTDGRMHLRFDTQREKITGGTKETLDIKIADELGTRDYATFSGGESFRVNFAVRLALSRLLARRAGAQLRTLIIDEGFGTQDAEGRERLVQAINAIQDEFDLILVITHIDELKDSFPARIEISKTPYGSRIELV